MKLLLLFALAACGLSHGAKPQKQKYIPTFRAKERVLARIDSQKFNPRAYERNLRFLQDNFKRCLLKKGIEGESFAKCVGNNYSKIGSSFEQTYSYMKTLMRRDFNFDIYRACKEENAAVCNSLNSTLDSALENDENPIKALQKKQKIANISKEAFPFFNRALENARLNFKALRKCKDIMKETKRATVRQLIDFVKGTRVKVGFNFAFNPFGKKKVQATPPRSLILDRGLLA